MTDTRSALTRDTFVPWETPRVTDNALLLLGYIQGSLNKGPGGRMYETISVNPDDGVGVVENTSTGNRYSIIVTQIGGIE